MIIRRLTEQDALQASEFAPFAAPAILSNDMPFDGFAIGAFHNHKMVGIILAKKIDKSSYTLMELNVAFKSRNSAANDKDRDGLGSQLFNSLLALIDTLPEHPKTKLHVMKTNEYGLRIYRKAGFIEVGSLSDDILTFERAPYANILNPHYSDLTP